MLRTWCFAWATAHRRGHEACACAMCDAPREDALPHVAVCPRLWAAITTRTGIGPPADVWDLICLRPSATADGKARGGRRRPSEAALRPSIACGAYHKEAPSCGGLSPFLGSSTHASLVARRLVGLSLRGPLRGDSMGGPSPPIADSEHIHVCAIFGNDTCSKHTAHIRLWARRDRSGVARFVSSRHADAADVRPSPCDETAVRND